ncbi:hypothetical protein [Paenibacillus humicus]|nr:hypothetical protein [Paenibacillus humicus]
MARIDPIMQGDPWEFIYDEKGRIIGEVYLLVDIQRMLMFGKRKGKRK